MTREELATRARMSVTAVSYLERGLTRPPQKETVLLLAVALGLTGDERDAFAGAARRRPMEAAGAVEVGASAIDSGDALPQASTRLHLKPLTSPLGREHDEAAVVHVISQTLGARLAGGGNLTEAVAGALKNRDVVLLLDNFEQVLTAARELMDVLARAPRTKMLVTSRLPLNLRGERVFPVRPLGLPARDATPGPVEPAERDMRVRDLDWLRATVGADALALAEAQGRAWSLGQAKAHAREVLD